MTKQEFLTELQKALTNKMSAAAVSEHVNYYREYIEVEMRKGKTEDVVTEELGSPRLIAKSILSAAASDSEYEGKNTSSDHAENRQNSNTNWYRTVPGALVLIILLIVLVFVGLFLTSIIRIFLPVILPIILIVLLIKIWKKYR